MSTTLKVNGIAGVKGNTWDIHWDDTSVQRAAGSVVPITEAHVIDQEKQIISFEAELELPGDYYEFTVDAVNEGTVNGIIDDISITFQDENDEDIELPEYLIYSFTHANGTEVEKGQVLEAGKSDGYRFRIEYDSTLEELPETIIPTIKPSIGVTYVQTREEDTRPYIITFNTTPTVTIKSVPRGDPIGEMPEPSQEDSMFLGWSEDPLVEPIIQPNYVPQRDMTLLPSSTNSYAVFDTGQNVNVKLKSLVGDDVSGVSPYSVMDTAITSIVRSNTAPAQGTTTENLSIRGADILAWNESGTIKIYSEAEELFLNSDASYMFYNFSECTSLYTNFNTRNTTNMSNMFASAKATSIDVSSFNTSNVTNMSGMFSSGSFTSLNLSNFDTRNVTDMSAMFAGCSSLTSVNISSFRTPKLTNMSSMFAACQVTNVDLSKFDVSKVTNFGGLFGGCGAKTINVSNWNFASVTSFGGIFAGAYNVESIDFTNVDTSKITNMYSAFGGLSNLKSLDLSSFDTSRVTNMTSMFGGCSSLTTITVGDDFVVDQVTSSSTMFGGATNLVGGQGTTYTTDHLDKEYAHYDGGEDNPGYFNSEFSSYNTVTFDANGGTVSQSSKRVGEGTEIGTLPLPTKSGYAFTGWYLNNTKITKNYVPTQNITVVAHWDEVKTMFDTGPNVSIKIKTLAGNVNPIKTTQNTNVTSIERSQTAPAQACPGLQDLPVYPLATGETGTAIATTTNS